MAYSLATSFMGDSLISGFEFFNGTDPSNGFVQYQDLRGAWKYGLYSVDPFSENVRLRPDSINKFGLDEGRPSVRLESKESYQYGLFIADFQHMPISQCGTWPAFWAYGANWPMGGEVDILEGANLAYTNIMSAHTAEGCMLDPADSSLFSGERLGLDCGVGSDNVGCGFRPPESDTSSYGDAFNAIGGGVYAMEWDSEYISIWHFPRGAIPSDIEAKRPDPRRWGIPQSLFGGSKCNVDDYFNDMRIVLNINFCGDYGEGTWRDSETCRSLAPTCREYVANNPTDFQDAYYDVSYIDVYTRIAGSIPPVIPSSSSETSTQISEPNPNTPISGNPPFPSTGFPSNSSTTARPNPSGKLSQSEEPTTTTTTTGISSVLVTIPGSGTVSPTVSPIPVATGGRSVNPAKVGDYSYLGCFGSQAGFQTFDLSTESDDMTIEQCVDSCNGLTYIGIFEGSCYCASKLNADTRAVRNETSCNRPCPGDDEQFCGGMVSQSTSTRSRRSVPLRRDAPNNILLTVYADISDADQPEVPPAMGPVAAGTTSVSGGVVDSPVSSAAASDQDSSNTQDDSSAQNEPTLSNLVGLTASNDLTDTGSVPPTTKMGADITDATDVAPVVGTAVATEAAALDPAVATDTDGTIDADADPVVVLGTASNGQVIEATGAFVDANRETVISTISYFTILPSNPGSLVPQESVVTMQYEQCDYCKTPTLIKPPMATRVVECDGCGTNGENTVTLTIPVSVTVTVPGGNSTQAQQTNNADAVATSGGNTVPPVVPSGMESDGEGGESSPDVTTIVITYLTTRIITYGTSTNSVTTETRTARRTVVVTIANTGGEMSILPVPSPRQPNTPVTLATPTPGAPVVVSGASSRRDDISVYFAILAMAILAVML
ncbi:Ff.00g029390.m01.CDS01 [Fusarium sp. VM40]|nr:Ff.00g029390.m01.CDS01 [Fusarium sp. VM40]